jgi:hypothetical protein
MRFPLLMALVAFPLQTACAQEAPAAQSPADDAASEPVPDDEIFAAAGFARTARGWEKCGDDSGSPSYTPGLIEQRGDFNGDGLPDAVVTEGGAYCFGDTGTGYTLVSQQADGDWRIMDEQPGMLTFLSSTGSEGWPDISVGGPGFCFPVVRWNGKEYAQNRREYEGKAC